LRHSERVDFDLLITGSAAIIGFLVGLTGVGAGALMTPLLIVGFGISAPVAIATDLLYATITKLVGGATHMRAGAIQWDLLRRLWVGGIAGAVVGAGLVIGLVSSNSATAWLKYPLAVLIALASVSLFLRLRSHRSPGGEVSKRPAPSWLATGGGAGIGLAVSMTSVGAGALGMALLTRLTGRGAKPHSLVGTDLLLAVPIALIAGLGYLGAGLVDFALLGSLLLGSLPGVLVGSALSQRISGRVLTTLVAIALASAAVMVVAS